MNGHLLIAMAKDAYNVDSVLLSFLYKLRFVRLTFQHRTTVELCSYTIFAFLFTTLSIIFCCDFANDRKIYIVYMGALPQGNYSPTTHYLSILQDVLENCSPSDVLIHSYKRSFNGFAANLTDKEVHKLASMKGIISVFPSRKLELQTTRSWDFIGFKENVKRVPIVESDVIVGVIDSGICPEAETFSDKGFGPPPNKWKGRCNGGQNFTCNMKLIGARFYSSEKVKDHNSTRDTDGHGTHAASIAAGNQVNHASFYGIALGDARGAVPSSRIAAYKVCWEDYCHQSDILAAFDDAIADGVDIISISIGGADANDYYGDPIAIGAFHAMQKGVLTSQSAGNSGPERWSVASVAPWKLSVAASSTDRQLVTKVILGDNTTLVGKAVNSFDMKGKMFPLGDEDEKSVKGRIVLRLRFSQGGEELDAKAAGMILSVDEQSDVSESYALPASHLRVKDGKTIKSYMNNTRNPVATIMKTDAIRDASAPVVASFSARGPNFLTKDILKPDITAPGADILAAWPQGVSPSKVDKDKRSVKYNILSGTSMSCPHASGAAAYVKSFHPDWSPAAIKSALMTTALPMNAKTNPDAELSFGAGQINPVKAADPGLVYDADEDDYLNLLCNIGYDADQIEIISGHKSSCSKDLKGSPKDLNYPSMISEVNRAEFTRTVTNVGFANSTYKATVIAPSKVKISVTPEVISFESLNEKRSFVVSVTTMEQHGLFSGSLVWSDGVHTVRSPVVVYLDPFDG